MTVYSNSKLEVFEKCRLKFKFKYVDNIKVLEKSIDSFLGSMVHSTLEWFYNELKENKTPLIDDIIIYYSEKWKKNYNSKKHFIIRKNLTQKDYFNKGIKFLLEYYLKHRPFEEKTIETEKRIIIDLNEEHKLIGYIDRLAYNEKENSYEIHDYKTANNLPRKEEIEQDRQLALYSLAIKNEFGDDKEIHLVWHYLAFNKTIELKKTSRDLEQLKKGILELIKKIEATNEFPPNKSVLCDWCEYKKICPVFGNVIAKKEEQTSLENYSAEKKV